MIDRGRLADLTQRELQRFADSHPQSRKLWEKAQESLVGGVPMPWMMRWAGGFPPWRVVERCLGRVLPSRFLKPRPGFTGQRSQRRPAAKHEPGSPPDGPVRGSPRRPRLMGRS